MPPDSEAALSRNLLRRLAGSLRIVLIGALVFVGLGVFLVFLVGRAADERSHALAKEEFDRSTLAIADALRPVLRAATPGDVAIIEEAMSPYAGQDRTLHLFFTPRGEGFVGVYFIVGAPKPAAAQAEEQVVHAVTSGTLGDFSSACLPAAAGRTVTPGWAVVALASPSGCWRLVAMRPAMRSSVPFLALPPIRSTALAAAAAALLMFAAAILAMMQTRRLRQIEGFGHAFAEITAVSDPELLPLPANDGAAREPAEEPSSDASSQVLVLHRGVVDLSAAVQAYADAAHAKLGADAGHLKAEVEPGLVIDGRADFVRTILEELLDAALNAPLGGAPICISLSSEAWNERERAVLTVTTPFGPAQGDAGGRLSHIKQFIAALGAAVTIDRHDDGAEQVALYFPLVQASGRVRTDAL